ncbi:glycoside hydrolase family 26 protein [Actinoplanes sp. DH11]|uniref:glycoside hydrolase family 26 protein n=1 Tax=Actinoplanes sp. DH11 TaxID=2857011 RepID=UPI001E5C0153|nr:glycosyl hydrolase [Actinoplanes sp. DH11]
MRTPHLLLAMSVFVAGVFGYAAFGPDFSEAAAPVPVASALPPSAAPTASAATAYDVTHLLRPAKNYLGVAIDGAPQDMSRVDAFAARVGQKPNMVTIYESFDDDFAASEIRDIYRSGALPILRWEPFKQDLADIAEGRFDDYVSAFARDVRRVNVPIALTVAHEMNGHWYPWGTQKSSAKDFVAAWRHIHDLFTEAGATNVIWTWTPNVTNYLPGVALKPFWPGEKYVDWVGVDGYFTRKGVRQFDQLFGPTLKEIAKFADLPVLIVETGSEPGSMRPAVVDQLLAEVARSKKIIGFVYFNARGSGDWVLDYDEKALKTWRTHPDRDAYEFTVK